MPEGAAARPKAACDPGPRSLAFRLTCGGYMTYTTAWLSERAGLYRARAYELGLTRLPLDPAGRLPARMTYGWAKEELSRNSLRAGTLTDFLAAAEAYCFLAPYLVRFLAASRLRKQRFTTERALQRAYRTIVADLDRDQRGRGTRVVVCCGDAGQQKGDWQGPFAGHASTKMSTKRLAAASEGTPGVDIMKVSEYFTTKKCSRCGCVVSLVRV